jgi:hypothetical protein
LKIELLTNPGMHQMNNPEQDDARSEQEVLKSEQESHSNLIEELLREVGMQAGSHQPRRQEPDYFQA